MSQSTRSWVVGLLVFSGLLIVALAWQWNFGAYTSEFGGHPDEAGHVVTGLFIRDALVEAAHYAAGGFHGSPIRMGKEFADRYYTHYPKIGLGVWPPFFYLAQSAWTLPLGASRGTLLVFLGVLAAVLGWQLFRALRNECKLGVAIGAAAVLLSLPLVRTYYGMVMAETLSAVLMFGAALAFGDFLDRGRRSDAIWFGVLAALAILTKGTGLALALAAPLAVLLVRQWPVLRRPVLWLAVVIIVVLAGPWTWATRNLGRGGWLQPSPSWSFTAEAFPYYLLKFAHALGFALTVLFVIGVAAKVRGASLHRGRWAAVGALVPAVLVFQSIAPVGLEARHLIPILPPALMFAAAGFDAVAKRLGHAGRVAAFASIVLMALYFPIMSITTKASSGFAPLAATMLHDAKPSDVALVSSDATGEGMFIAEVALREVRPGHVIQRASKSLATSTWSGSGYAPLFTSDDEAFRFLSGETIQFLVVDDSMPAERRREHHVQLVRVVSAHPDTFRLLAESAVWRGGKKPSGAAKLYKIVQAN
jgi:hypothetical protein